MKSFHSPHHGHDVKLGRKRPQPGGKKLLFKDYLKVADIPASPDSCDFSGAAVGALSNIMLNDKYGCCVVAGGYHVTAVETGNAGSVFEASDAQIVADYSAIGGFDPNNPTTTDNGCDEEVAFKYWTDHGFANGTKLLGWVAIDATCQAEVQAAIWLFENAVTGIELPDAWVNPFPSGPGFTWGVAGDPDPNNGHCTIGCGYDKAKGFMTDTWGMLGFITWAALAKYCVATSGGMLYVLLSPDQLAKGQSKAPNGVDWTALLADFAAMGGAVAPPSPTPAPPVTPPDPVPAPPAPVNPPAPLPAPTVTLDQAKQILEDGWPKT